MTFISRAPWICGKRWLSEKILRHLQRCPRHTQPAFTICFRKKRNGAVPFLRWRRYFRCCLLAASNKQRCLRTCLSPKHGGAGVSFSAPAKDCQYNGCYTSILPWDRLNAGNVCSAPLPLRLCPGGARLGSSLQNVINFSASWISFLYPSMLLWVQQLIKTLASKMAALHPRNWKVAVCF